MKRIQYYRYGGPEVLRLEEVPLPEPSNSQIRVRIRAAAANPVDWKIRNGGLKIMTGRAFPRGLGQDFSGVVEAVGPRAKRFKVGDEVFGATGQKDSGAFAEALVTDEKTVLRKPRSLSFEAAAAMPTVSSTAWVALIDQAKLRPDQSVFITSCLGGVGRAAAQFARMRGAKIAGSCSASRRDEAIALGVLEVVDYRDFQAKTFRGRFDVVFDTHGSLSLGECGVMLKRGGVAEHCVPTPQKMIWSLLSSRHQTVFSRMTPPFMDALFEAAEQGKLTPAIGRTVPLSEAIPAIVELEKTGSPRGNWSSFRNRDATHGSRLRLPSNRQALTMRTHL